MTNNIVEAVGFVLVLAFLWFVWPPLVLLGAGLLLVLWANTRTTTGRLGAVLGAATAAARRAYQAHQIEQVQKAELRRVA